MRRILVGSGCLSIAIVICWSTLPVAAATIVTGSVQTFPSGVVDCDKSFTSSTGGSVSCQSTAAYAGAGGNAAFGSISAGATRGGPSRASASASYDEMVYITGGVGAGTLTIVYHALKEEAVFGPAITQGDQFSSICPMFPGSTCTLTSTFVYDVPFKMAASLEAVGGDIRFHLPSHVELQIQSAMDQAGHTVTLNIVVPEPGTLLVTGLGLVWAVLPSLK